MYIIYLSSNSLISKSSFPWASIHCTFLFLLGLTYASFPRLTLLGLPFKLLVFWVPIDACGFFRLFFNKKFKTELFPLVSMPLEAPTGAEMGKKVGCANAMDDPSTRRQLEERWKASTYVEFKVEPSGPIEAHYEQKKEKHLRTNPQESSRRTHRMEVGIESNK